MSKKLFLLDLDHTLIYGSYAMEESADFLFQYSEYLKIYERPLARELIKLLKSSGDIIVYTTAKKDYAERIAKELNIKPITLLTRKQCVGSYDGLKKKVKEEWRQSYSKIVIIDDSPQVWPDLLDTDVMLSPSEFRGYANDLGLKEIIEKISANESE